MKRRAIATVILDSLGRLHVAPEPEAGGAYEHIYREANGLRWDRALQAVHAYEPERWEHVELLRHILATVASAYGEQLQFTEATAWQGVPSELQVRLSSVVQYE